MKTRLFQVIASRISDYISALGANPRDYFDIQIPPDPSKGDFALNGALKLAKIAKQSPLKLAQEFARRLADDKDWFEKVEAVPPGFVNIFLKNDIIQKILLEKAKDQDLSIKSQNPPQRVVIDYSSVNIAKQMHVGHLRSTIIGDVLSRVLEARGEVVIRQNHLGDWGLPMAKVLWKVGPMLRRIESEKLVVSQELNLAKLEIIYRDANRECEENPVSATACHEVLVALQNGDQRLLDDWKTVTRISMAEVYRIYDELGVLLKPEHEAGESFYRNMLADTVTAIQDCKHLTESQGAKCVFLESFKAKDGSPLPVIVQKSDGGFNYETFDLAAIRYRIGRLFADRVIYVTDSRQVLHFAQVFEVAKICGWTTDKLKTISLEHVPFGTILGEDNKPFKTRSGENVKLSDLISEAVSLAYSVVQEKNPSLSEEKKRKVAQAVGIGAIKYSDLCQNRNNDYVFSFKRMLSLNGNTAPYLQYAHARICSIFRKGEYAQTTTSYLVITHPAERDLALKLLRFPEALEMVEVELRPHILCNYLFELATAFSTFYDQCPVIVCNDSIQKNSRFYLCRVTQRTLALGLNLLGIDAPEEM